MKTVLITGSNKGIGFETARQLGKKNFHVIISGRSKNKLQEVLDKLKAESISAEILIMDVSKPESIRDAAQQFAEKNKNLDVLINNAAILKKTDKSLSENSTGILDETLQTNCLGALNVIKAFGVFMQAGSRVINISSGGGSMTDPVGGWAPAYCVSKSLLNAMTRQLAHELMIKKISVNAVCPGWVRTDMGGADATREVSKGAETPVWLASEADSKLTGKFFRDQMEIDW